MVVPVDRRHGLAHRRTVLLVSRVCVIVDTGASHGVSYAYRKERRLVEWQQGRGGPACDVGGRLPTGLVYAQIVAVLDDLVPEVAKTGFLAGLAAINAIDAVVDRLPPLIVDSVCVDKHDRPILDDATLEALRATLLPRAALLTPNLAEAALLAGVEVRDRAGMERAATRLLEMGAAAALIKGGRLGGACSPDLLATRAGLWDWLDAPRVPTAAVHGSGDTLAASIAARLAWGADIPTAVRLAKAYITTCLEGALEIGRGQGPVGHPPAPPA